jgi:hypothetical protein
MFNFEVTVNPTTGEQQKRANFSAKLISISDKTLTNVNGTEYRVATIEFKDAKGVSQRVSAMIYENNFKYGMTVGETYNATVTITSGNAPLITVSHLTGSGVRATADMFGLSVAAPKAAFAGATIE